MTQPESMISSRSTRRGPALDDARRRGERPVHPLAKATILAVPPGPSAQQQEPDDQGVLPAMAPRAPKTRRGLGSLAGGQHAFPHSRAGDGHDAGEEEQAEAAEQNPERALEREPTVGHCGDGNDGRAGPCAPLTATVTLFEPGAMIQSRVEYQPSAPTGRATSGGGAPAVASYMFTMRGDLLGLGVRHLHVDVGDPGDHARQAHVHHDMVGARGSLVPDVRAAHVGRAQRHEAREAGGRGDEPSGSSQDPRHPAAPPEPDACRSHRDEEREGEAAGERHTVEVAGGVLGTPQNRCCHGPGRTM